MLSNHNGELVTSSHLNLLDSPDFSVKFIHKVNRILFEAQGFETAYDEMTLDKTIFVCRLENLARYYGKTHRQKDGQLIRSLSKKIRYLEMQEVTVKNPPDLWFMDQKLTADLLRNIALRRVLYGFTVFKRLFREEVLERLEGACALTRR